jgi:hypothetical protein
MPSRLPMLTSSAVAQELSSLPILLREHTRIIYRLSPDNVTPAESSDVLFLVSRLSPLTMIS